MTELVVNFHYLISLIINLILIIIFIFSKEIFHRWLLPIILVILILLLAHSLILSYFQYLVFKSHPLSQYLLPPYQNINYFLGFVFYHYFRNFYFRLVGTLLNFFIMLILNSLFKKTLFYEREYNIILIVSLLIDFPFNLLLIPLNLFIIMFLHIQNLIFKKNSPFQKISAQNYWLIISLFIIIINILTVKFNLSLPGLTKLMP